MGLTDFWTTYMVTAERGRDLDWGAGRKHIEDVPDEELEKAGAFEYLLPTTSDGRPVDPADGQAMEPARAAQACRDMLKDKARMLEGAVVEAGDDGCLESEVRRVGDRDAYILYDNPEDPVGLWSAGDAIDELAPGWWAAVGFDVDVAS